MGLFKFKYFFYAFLKLQSQKVEFLVIVLNDNFSLIFVLITFLSCNNIRVLMFVSYSNNCIIVIYMYHNNISRPIIIIFISWK